MSQRISFTAEEVLREVALDSDMEPSDDEFSPESDDFIAESSENEAIIAPEPSTSSGRQRRGGGQRNIRSSRTNEKCVCLQNYPPFKDGRSFVTIATTLKITQEIGKGVFYKYTIKKIHS